MAAALVALCGSQADAGMAVPNTGWTGSVGVDYAFTGNTEADWMVIDDPWADAINAFAADNGLTPLDFDREDSFRVPVTLGRSWITGVFGDNKDRTTVGAYLEWGPDQEAEATFQTSIPYGRKNIGLSGMVHADVGYQKFYANVEFARQVGNNINVGVHLRGGAVLASVSDGVVSATATVDYGEGESESQTFSAAGCDDDVLTWGVQPGVHAEYEFTNQIAVGLQASWSYIDGPTFTCQDKIEVETDSFEDWQVGLYGKVSF